MIYQIMAIASFTVGIVAATLGGSTVAAAGAFVGAGMFAIADAIKSKK